ncbi:hypothetical protein OsI_35235 [Oryza sativa Indica Group]|uniref:Uncharacterized protein n=1 Tax=Oryza sativa subsp. indica TaxID=39946 RepID=B8BJ99_ORYSI|nr:hypothetical protein OsI_35235 [Oryza sativa Indica Group]
MVGYAVAEYRMRRGIEECPSAVAAMPPLISQEQERNREVNVFYAAFMFGLVSLVTVGRMAWLVFFSNGGGGGGGRISSVLEELSVETCFVSFQWTAFVALPLSLVSFNALFCWVPICYVAWHVLGAILGALVGSVAIEVLFFWLAAVAMAGFFGYCLAVHARCKRRHSWSIEHGAGTSVSPSPSPTKAQSRGSPQLGVPLHVSLKTCSHPQNASSSGQKKYTPFEECYPSPPLSPSPSQSPSANYPKNPLFRYESAPVTIPTLKSGGGGGSGLPPSPCSKGKHQFSSHNDNLAHSPDHNSNVRKDLVRLGEFEKDMALQKVLSYSKYDLGYFHGLKLTRTSSKLFIMDELDEHELVFAWEDRDTIIDQLNRADISDREEQKNQDAGGSSTRSPAAAIGALVHLLKTAPSLREGLQSDAAAVVPQEPSSVQKVVTEEHGSIASSSTPVTATDALEELKKYREVKESILNRGKTQVSDTNLGEKLTDGEP